MTEKTNDFDPSAPFVAQDLLEYPNLGAYLRGEPYANTRNGNILFYKWAWGALQWWDTFDYAEGFDICAAGRPNIGPSPLFARCHEAGIALAEERQAARTAEGAGRPGAVAAPPAAVHSAPEPEVPRGLGA